MMHAGKTATRKHTCKTRGGALARAGGLVACLRPAEVEARLPALVREIGDAYSDLLALLPAEAEPTSD